MSKGSSTRRFVLIVCSSFIVAGAAGFWFSREPNTLRVWFADVGQGDGIILRTPSQQTIVIDGGVRSDFVQEVDDHVPITDRTIDLVVATHADADHITGLVNLIASGRVRAVLFNQDASVKTKVYARLLDAITDQGVTVIEAQAGQEFSYGDVHLRVLWPTPEGFAAAKTTNERSVVLKVSYDDQDVLLTGDAPESIEARLIQQWGSELDVEVLKVGHHGSSHSSTKNFLEAVASDIAIISVGAKNRYGHPSQRVLEDVQQIGARVFRTDELGDVLVTCSVNACGVMNT